MEKGKKSQVKEPASIYPSKPKFGPNIIRAWFDTVMNPLLDGLRTAHGYVSQQNWTWRRSGHFEILRTLQGYIGSEMRDNLQQFLDLHPELEAIANQYTENLMQLQERCIQLSKLILQSSQFDDVYAKATSEPSLERLGVTIESVFGGYSKEDRRELVIQYMVNRVQALPDYYVGYRIWNESREEFLKLLDGEDIAVYTAEMDKVGDALSSTMRQLIEMLERTRLQLSLDYDVPYKLPQPPMENAPRIQQYGR